MLCTAVLISIILPEVTVVMFLCNTGQSCHLQHAAVARNCYELQSMLWQTLDCYFEHDNQTPCNTHCEPESKNDNIVTMSTTLIFSTEFLYSLLSRVEEKKEVTTNVRFL